jgi:hypothetical protein
VAAQEAPRADGWVVLPIDEYRALRARAFPTTPDPAPPPVDAALTRVDYDLRVSGETVSGQARLTIDVLKQGWASVQVPPACSCATRASTAVRRARANGTPPRVLISRAGRSTLTLDVVVPLRSSAGSESIALPASGSALSAVTLIVPRTGVALTSPAASSPSSRDRRESRWVVFGNARPAADVQWKRRPTIAAPAAAAHARAHHRARRARRRLDARSRRACRSTSRRDSARTRRRAAAGIDRQPGRGPTVADWDVDRNRADGHVPRSDRDADVGRRHRRAARAARRPVAIPIVRVPSAERETGGIAVDVTAPARSRSGEPRGLEPADAADLGDVVAGHESPSMVAFRFTPLAGARRGR